MNVEGIARHAKGLGIKSSQVGKRHRQHHFEEDGSDDDDGDRKSGKEAKKDLVSDRGIPCHGAPTKCAAAWRVACGACGACSQCAGAGAGCAARLCAAAAAFWGHRVQLF